MNVDAVPVTVPTPLSEYMSVIRITSPPLIVTRRNSN